MVVASEKSILDLERDFDEGRYEELARKGTELRAAFLAAGNERGAADALRLGIVGRRYVAEKEGESAKQADITGEAELKTYREVGDRRGEGLMLLALCECNSDRRGCKKREKALQWAMEALGIFQDIGDKKLEGETCLELSLIHYKKRNDQETLRWARQALKIFQSMGNKRGQALAFHGLANGKVLEKDFGLTMQHAQESCDLFREVGIKKLEAGMLRTMAQWRLAQDKPDQALAMAKEALSIFRNHPGGTYRESRTLNLVVMGLLGKDKAKQAVKVCNDAIELFQKDGDAFGECGARESLAQAYMYQGRIQDALRAIEPALAIHRRSGDKKEEIDVLCHLSTIYQEGLRGTEALHVLQEALEIARDLKSKNEEACVLQRLSELYGRIGESEDSLKFANDSRALFRKLGKKREEGAALFQTAVVQGERNNYKDAMATSHAAKELFVESGDKRREALTFEMISRMHKAEGDLQEALSNMKKCAALWEHIGRPAEAGQALYEAATLLVDQKQFKEVEDVALDARRLHREAGDKSGELLTAMLRMQVMTQSEDISKDDLSKAAKLSNETLFLSGKSGNQSLRAGALFWHAYILLLQDRPDSAIRSAGDSVAAYAEIEDKASQVHSQLLISNARAMLGEREQAKFLAEQALELARSCGDDAAINAAESAVGAYSDGGERIAPRKVEQAIEEAPTAVETSSAAAPVVEAASAYTEENVKNELTAMITDLVGSDDPVEVDTPLMGYGIDSLSGIQLAAQISKAFSMTTTPTLVFEYPNIATMIEYVLQEAGSRA